MTPLPILLAIDQGTTSSRAVVYRTAPFGVMADAQQENPQHSPHDGWVEHEPEYIWDSVAPTERQAVAKAGIDTKTITAIGITNQRETVAVWNAPAVGWRVGPSSGRTTAPPTSVGSGSP